jgi:hypothetical protein
MKSKLGFHIGGQVYPGQLDKIVRAGTRLVKVLGSTETLKMLYSGLGDRAILIARDQRLGDDFVRFARGIDPRSAAQHWMSQMRPLMAQAPFAYWESFDDLTDWSKLRAFGEFEAERQRLMAAEGFKACIGNFAAGTPEIETSGDRWADFYPALEVANQLGNILGLHEYSGLYMDLWYGPNQSQAIRSGQRVPFPADYAEGWLFARYRKVWRLHLKPNGWTNVRIALTELGLGRAGEIDADFLAGEMTRAWTSCVGTWQRRDGRTDAPQFYVEQLQWCDGQMQRDAYLIGGAIYTWGAVGSALAFEIEGRVADTLVAYIQRTRDEAETTIFTQPTAPSQPAASTQPTPSTPAPSSQPATSASQPAVSVPAVDRLYVTPTVTEGLILRNGPSMNAQQIGSLFPGDTIEVLGDRATERPKVGQRGYWLNVRTASGQVGWVGSRYLQVIQPQPQPQPQPEPQPAEVPLYLRTTEPEGLRVRSGPGSQNRVLAVVRPQDKLEALGSRSEVLAKLGKLDEWIQVKTPQSITGWCAAWYLEEMPRYLSWPVGHALVGLHGPADPGEWPWDEGAYQTIRQGRVEAVKLLAAADIGSKVVDRLRAEGVKFIMARLFAKFTEPRTPQQFVQEVADVTRRLYECGLRYFEVHNEPNLNAPDSPEGMWICWRDGREFGQFFQEAVSLLKQIAPDAQFGFPGLSPGGDIPRVRAASEVFLAQADAAVRGADFVCMHTYWGREGLTYVSSIREIKAMCDRYPDKLIIVSEFSNNDPYVAKDVKGQEYVLFYTEARKLPSNLGALFSYVLSASSGYQGEVWKGSRIAELVGKRPPVG